MRPYTLLKGYADAYESATKLRMDTNNRMRNWLRDTLPPEQWGDIDFADEKLSDETVFEHLPNDQRAFVEMIAGFEKATQKHLWKEIKKHPLYPWLEGVRGIGPNLAAKLLSKLGDIDRFPTVSHMWSYCGLDGPDWRKNKHSWDLTSIGYLVADSFQYQKKGSDGYRDVYDKRKEYEATRPPCSKCIEQGFLEHCRPGHINNKARRYAVKQFLKDLWIQNSLLKSGEIDKVG
jgi:hypothetical protein